ncbi:MAG: FtsB family cell division protein [Bacteroidia bacterium]
MNNAVFKFLTNKYVIATIGFLLLITLTERSSIFDYIKYKRELYKLKKQHEYYKNESERIKTEYNEVFGSKESLEKFAREKYFMKHDSEDVFVIVPEK